jgi:HSP20 family molecular chaperone IbpA
VETSDNLVTILLTAPGFNADDLKVSIVPGSAFIEGETERKASSSTDSATTSQRIARTFLYQVPLPETANIDAASATFHSEELRVTVPLKTEQTVGHKGKAGATTA